MKISLNVAHKKSKLCHLTATLSVALSLFSIGCKDNASSALTACAAPNAVACGTWAGVTHFNPPLAMSIPQVTLATKDTAICENTSGTIIVPANFSSPSVTVTFETALSCSITSAGACVCVGVNTIPDPNTPFGPPNPSLYPTISNYTLSLTCVDPKTGLSSTYADAGGCY